MRIAVIFRSELLPLSETFIKAQATALERFRACYAGLMRLRQSLPVPEDAILLMHGGSIPDRIRRRIFLYTGWAPTFSREFRGREVSLVHAHFAPDAATILPLAKRLQLPFVVSLHGYDVTCSEQLLKRSFAGRLYLKRKRELFESASVFVCASEFLRQRALAAGYPESKLRVHYIGVDRTFFVPRPAPRDRNVVLFVGRLIEQKGVRFLIRAMELVSRSCPEAKLVLIGDGPERASFEALAAEKGVPCEFLGTQPSSAVRQWLSRSQVFCAPSITGAGGAQEGLGMVFAEAQAMGVPVVSFQNGGIPEVVRHGETGLLAPERDVETLAEHLLRFLNDEPFRRASSNRAIDWIKKQFDLRVQTQGLEDIYLKALVEARAK